VFPTDLPLPPQAGDPLGGAQADARHPEDHGVVRRVDVHREKIRLAKRERQFGVDVQVQVQRLGSDDVLE